mgnify:CR=1 FL=1
MINYREYFLFNESAGPNKHLTHLEELILTNGKDGAIRATQYLQALTDVLDSNTPKPINTTVKYDGAPAVVIGVDPNGNFFVGSKSVFAKTPKLNYSIDDIKRNHAQSPGLVDKLVKTFSYFKNVNFNSTYQGDFLKLQFPQTYDIVSAWHVLEHVTDIDAFLKKCASLTRGYCIIEVPTLVSLTGEGRRRELKDPAIGLYDGHAHYFTKKSFEIIANKYFSIIEIKEGVQAPALLAIMEPLP